MAPQPKKRSTSRSRKIKSGTTVRTKKKGTTKSSVKKNVIIVTAVFLMIGFVTFGYFLGQSNTTGSVKKQVDMHLKESKGSYSTAAMLDDLAKIEVKRADQSKVEVPKTVQLTDEKDADPLPEIKSNLSEKKTNIALAYRAKKPKLVIILDDVSSAKQLKQIQNLPYKVTPSIFPPYEYAMSSHKLAQGLKHYMIHLPMQSGKSFDKQYKTLKITDDPEKIEARVKEIRRLFPTARYINNHTGSLFTSHYEAMKLLYEALKKEGFVFVDSRTTGRSKVKKIAHDYGDAYVARDIFLDNIHDIHAIHKQLKKAVSVAKKKGYAIAIGHPHQATLNAITQAGNLLKAVDVVYIDEIYRK
jgi:polysaccharide deacetylase 2 family uncharacterized protein YibQ